MLRRPCDSGSESGFPTGTHTHTGDKSAQNHQHSPENGVVRTVSDLPAGQEPESLDLAISSRWKAWSPFVSCGQQAKLRNDLHVATGLLEFANLGDAAANYWNTIPIPKVYEALMWLGGIVALSMLWFVCIDARRSWRNIQGLKGERKRVKCLRDRDGDRRHNLDCLLQVNIRELGTEWDRLVMVALLGFGALLVSVGTFMAPFGARRDLFKASNYLTGHVGNAPCAIYGLFNALFAGFLCVRAVRHRRTTAKYLKDGKVVELLRRRTDNVIRHGILNGITVLGAGAAAMCTATHSKAYAGLAPICLISFGFNLFWRREIGYTRQFYEESWSFDEKELLDAIVFTHALLEQANESQLTFELTMEYIVLHGAFEDFCIKLLKMKGLGDFLLLRRDPQKQTVRFNRRALITQVLGAEVGDKRRQNIEKTAKQTLREHLRYRERWLLEMIGCHFSIIESYQDSGTFSIEKRAEEGRVGDDATLCGGRESLEKGLEESWHSGASTVVPTPDLSTEPAS